MAKMIHARLDEDAHATLEELVAKLGSTESQVIRQALKHLAATLPSHGKKKIVGLAKFSSGTRDLGSNKKHLAGFGR